MPEKSETISVSGYDASRLQALAYGAFQHLGWTVKYAGVNILLAYTPKSWGRCGNEITAKTEDNQLTVTSKMIHGESFDIRGRTKKDTRDFLSAIETTRAGNTDLNIQEWNEKIAALKDETMKAAEQEERSERS